MIKDEDLKQAIDYSQGQKDAAYMVLGEIVSLLNEFADDMYIIGGWVPSLLFPNGDHIGSIDVDVLLNQQTIKDKSYRTIKQILASNGYKHHPEHFFTFVKTVNIQNIEYDVDVDFISGEYGGKGGKFSKHVGGVKTLPISGGNFAFDFTPIDVPLSYNRLDGAKDIVHVNVVSIVPYLIMKAKALGRGKPKDAYDIYYVVNNYPGGVRALVDEFLPYKEKELIQNMCRKLGEKFMSIEHAGPADICSFLGVHNEDDAIQIKQDAYQKINYLVSKLLVE